MSSADDFCRSRGNANSHDEWNQAAYWDGYYEELLKERDPRRRQLVAYREVDLLLRMLEETERIPRTSPATMLDAGCGISLIPHLLAYIGFTVTGLDLCATAVDLTQGYDPAEEDLARCVPVWDQVPGSPRVRELVNDPLRSLQRLQQLHVRGGAVRFQVDDWFSPALTDESFDVIYCRNSLRRSIKSYWRRSLLRFRELLAPGGVLLLENVNVFEIRDEAETLITECGFQPAGSEITDDSVKRILSVWPTG